MLIHKISLNNILVLTLKMQHRYKSFMYGENGRVFLFNLKCMFSLSRENIHHRPKSQKMNHLSSSQGPKHPGPCACQLLTWHLFTTSVLCKDVSNRMKGSHLLWVFSPSSDRAQTAVGSLTCHTLYIKGCKTISNDFVQPRHHSGQFPI